MMQAGVLVYKVSEDMVDPLAFWLTEEWRTSGDLANHCSSDAYRDIAARSLKVVLQLFSTYANTYKFLPLGIVGLLRCWWRSQGASSP